MSSREACQGLQHGELAWKSKGEAFVLGWVTPASGSSSVEWDGWLICGSLWPCFSVFLVEASLKWKVVQHRVYAFRLWSKTLLSSPGTKVFSSISS